VVLKIQVFWDITSQRHMIEHF